MNKQEQKQALEDAIQEAVSECIYEIGIRDLHINANIHASDGWVKAEITED